MCVPSSSGASFPTLGHEVMGIGAALLDHKEQLRVKAAMGGGAWALDSLTLMGMQAKQTVFVSAFIWGPLPQSQIDSHLINTTLTTGRARGPLTGQSRKVRETRGPSLVTHRSLGQSGGSGQSHQRSGFTPRPLSHGNVLIRELSDETDHSGWAKAEEGPGPKRPGVGCS